MQELPEYVPNVRRGRPHKYDWKLWLSVGTRRIQQGIDFDSSLGAMENLIRKTASLHGVRISIHREPALKALVIVVKKEQDENPVPVNPTVDTPTMEGA